MPDRIQNVFLCFLVLCSAVTFSCATFNPRPISEVPFRERAQTQCENNVCVTAAVLNAEESQSVFDLPLYKKGIQPVWLKIQNDDEEAVWFPPASLDPDYFSPLEVAYMHHSAFSREENAEMDQYLRGQAIKGRIPAGRVRSGFVFTNLDMGSKAFNVDLVGQDHRLRTFTFFISVPGMSVSHQDVQWQGLYQEDEIVFHDHEKELRKALENLPCCVENNKGTEDGRPINLVIIGRGSDLHQVLIRRGWDETERLDEESTPKERAAIAKAYRYAAVRPLYLFGRRQDAAFTKTRMRGDERNHLRLWLSPLRIRDHPVWIGQISRDIKVRYVPHMFRLEPLVDEARTYLLQDLWFSQGLEKFGYVKGVGAAPMSAPRLDLEGSPFFTDGYRVVLWLSPRPVPFSDVGVVDWEVHHGIPGEHETVERP